VALLVALPGPGHAAITGICPDGSVFIVQTPDAIPCPDAKRVDPHEVPPMRPEYLPKPYTWEVYNQSANPNNPYNMIDAARQVRSLRGGAPAPSIAETPAVSSGPPSAGTRVAGNAGPPRSPVSLGLRDDELRDLFLIIELSQERADASFDKQTADGREAFRVALAHSVAFQARLQGAYGTGLQNAPVLLFSAVAKRSEPFHANFTFSQGHLAFHPDASDPLQLGVLQGHLGGLESGEVTVGYLVLPERMDLRQPIDLYWNDRRKTVTFAP
jgi:hypothetical protein